MGVTDYIMLLLLGRILFGDFLQFAKPKSSPNFPAIPYTVYIHVHAHDQHIVHCTMYILYNHCTHTHTHTHTH